MTKATLAEETLNKIKDRYYEIDCLLIDLRTLGYRLSQEDLASWNSLWYAWRELTDEIGEDMLLEEEERREANTFLTDKELAYCYNDVRGLCVAARMRYDTLQGIEDEVVEALAAEEDERREAEENEES